MSLTALITFLSAHHTIMYVVLFLGSYFETFIITSFFVYGEFFFIAGGILAGLGVANIWLVILSLFFGGVLGDQSSYALGRVAGDGIYTRFERTPVLRRAFTRKNHARGMRFFKQYGGISVLVGRFLGPVSWITPFLAGVFKVPLVRFVLYELPAAFFGIGQFILLGYIFGYNYERIVGIVQQYFLVVVFGFIIFGAIVFLLRRKLRRMERTFRYAALHYIQEIRRGNRRYFWRTVRVALSTALIIVLLYLFMLILMFFVDHQWLIGSIPPDLSGQYQSVQQIVNTVTTTTYYRGGTQDVGPINLIFITPQSIDTLLTAAGWHYTDTFSRTHIDLWSFLKQAEDGRLPISDLYYKGVPQNAAYTYATSSFSTREHLRVWNYGQLGSEHVYAISASKDIGIELYRSFTFVVPYHKTDLYVDGARDFTVDTLLNAYPSLTLTPYASPRGPRVKKTNDDAMYVTDGTISVLQF